MKPKTVVLLGMALLTLNGCRDAPASSPARRSPGTARARGFLDQPLDGARVLQKFNVAGWAVSQEGVKAVRIYLDDRLVATLPLTVPRPDVERSFPSLASAGRPHGFVGQVEARDVIGYATISAEAVDTHGGLTRVFSITVNVQP